MLQPDCDPFPGLPFILMPDHADGIVQAVEWGMVLVSWLQPGWGTECVEWPVDEWKLRCRVVDDGQVLYHPSDLQVTKKLQRIFEIGSDKPIEVVFTSEVSLGVHWMDIPQNASSTLDERLGAFVRRKQEMIRRFSPAQSSVVVL